LYRRLGGPQSSPDGCRITHPTRKIRTLPYWIPENVFGNTGVATAHFKN